MGCVRVRVKARELFDEVKRQGYTGTREQWASEDGTDGEFMLSGDDGFTPCSCGYLAEFLCDFPMGDGKTCDALLCPDCAMSLVAELTPLKERRHGLDDLHLCPAHYAIASKGTP
jgi:hypothetical protein